jgi:hypothetical protein
LGEKPGKYLIQWDPVGDGTACDEGWEPKTYASKALVAEWEERKKASVLGDSNHEQDDVPSSRVEDGEVSQRCSSAKQDSVDLVNDRESADVTILLEATGSIVPEYDHHLPRGLDDSSPMASKTLEEEPARPLPESVAMMTAAVEDNRFCAQSQPLGDMASDSGAGGFEQASEGHTTKIDGQRRPSPRTGTSISRNPGVSGAPSGKLASARKQLRSLLRYGSGGRRTQKSRSLFPRSPSPSGMAINKQLHKLTN